MNWLFSRISPVYNVIAGFMWGVSASEFAAWYALWLLVLLAAVYFLRNRQLNAWLVTGAGIISYEIPAVLRIGCFSPPYEHHWTGLIAMMVAGALAFWPGLKKSRRQLNSSPPLS